MRVVRMLWVAAVFVVAILELSCGDTFRPIAIPQNPFPPNPEDVHFQLVLTANGPETCPLAGAPAAPCDPDSHPGTSSRIDVSGDTNVGTATVGLGPVHAVLLPPNGSTAYVANLLDNTVTSYATASAGPPTTTITLPPGTNPIFLATTETGNVYVAGQGNTVSVISTAQSVVTKTLTLSDGIGHNPVAMVETPDTKKLYVVNQADNSVSAISTVDKTVNAVIPVGTSPSWAVARADSARVYVLNQDSVSEIDTANDVVLATVPVVGARYMVYDKELERLYLTIPSTAHLATLSVASDPPVALPSVDLSSACGAGCVLDSVTSLPTALTGNNKNKVYVSSHTIAGSCSPPPAGAPADNPPCVTTQVSVIQPPNNTLVKTLTMQHTVFVNSQAVGTKPDVPVVPFCDSIRFRRQIASAADGSRVFVANCDAGGTDIVRTSDDSFVLNLPAPVSSAPSLPGQSFPPPQNPVFVVAGR
jgi:YVTN family beta-propeller protein